MPRHPSKPQRAHVDPAPLPAVGLPHIQGLLYPACPDAPTRRVPAPRKLPALRRAHAPRRAPPLAAYLHTQPGRCTGISFIDSTSLSVCENARIAQRQVFRVDALRGKASVGWFYGFKLHRVIIDQGELLLRCLTPGNVDDRRPVPRHLAVAG
jgi:hypothetical protein